MRTPEQFPQCAMITSSAAVTFTFDEGRTLNDQQGVDAIAFSRKDPAVMYLGLRRIE